ncbi:hypothetical protein LTR37_019108 [Vermiconidia calcicola]|uniref:Uncharacterized protein n=1 Tax=Vermiconidia calcicola TaxID=1690605 RepID=A0ACC3MH21_9PEZI|nr:hypothetical protein LTR37_019108 [Vermiconidia calcicola]
MSNTICSSGCGLLQRPAVRINIVRLRGPQIDTHARSRPLWSQPSRASSWAASSSATSFCPSTRHIRLADSKSYATASKDTDSRTEARIISNTREYSPGHNVATLSISNPSKLNVVNSPLIEELITACRELSKDDALRAVVLTGAPTAAGKSPSFIGGADIKQMSQMSSFDEAREFISLIHNGCAALRDIPVPVIARVHGFALGAGLEIMASCDLRVATQDSVFGMPEVKIGLPSVIEAAYLPGLIGMGRTRRFLYLAENIKGPIAEQWGLVERLVTDEAALDQAVDEWLGTIVGMGPKSIRSQKKLMQKWENSTADEAIDAGVEALAESFRDGGKEPRGLMGSFLNRKR